MASKRWPAERWRELLGTLIVEQQAQLVIVGGRDDCAAAQEVTGAMPWTDVHDWTGRLTLPQLAATIEQADVLVGADSGPAHLAAAVGTSVVVLFSGTNSLEQWRPWGERVRVVRQPTSCSPCHQEACPLAEHPCMTGLRPSAVLMAIRKFLLQERMSSIISPTIQNPAQHPTQSPDHKEAA
jgi:ADP-heptose:LPS heptosyltransferase